jgi:hypothetical protein
MMGVRTPETCWTVNKHQVINWRNCCIWLVIYLNCMMMHGLTKFKRASYVYTQCYLLLFRFTQFFWKLFVSLYQHQVVVYFIYSQNKLTDFTTNAKEKNFYLIITEMCELELWYLVKKIIKRCEYFYWNRRKYLFITSTMSVKPFCWHNNRWKHNTPVY